MLLDVEKNTSQRNEVVVFPSQLRVDSSHFYLQNSVALAAVHWDYDRVSHITYLDFFYSV